MGFISVDNIMVTGFISELRKELVKKVSQGEYIIEKLDSDECILFEIDSNKNMTFQFLKDVEGNPFVYNCELLSVFNEFRFEAYKSLIEIIEVQLEFNFAVRVNLVNNKYELERIPFVSINDSRKFESGKLVFIYMMTNILEALNSIEFNHETGQPIFINRNIVARLQFKEI